MRARVLLLGLETQIGLTIVRELAQHGVEVHGVARSRQALGLYSKYLTQGHRRVADAQLLDQLRTLTAQLAPCHIMAISENDIAWLNRMRSALTGVKILVPEEAAMAVVLDKSLTQRYAQEVGIQIPASIELTTMAEFDEALRDFRFPAVCKWKNPLLVAPSLRKAGLPLDKVRYCQSREELRDYLARFAEVGAFPVVQQYCAGYGLGQFVFMHKGEAIMTFQHRRVHEWPPEGGFSTLCEGLADTEHADLMHRSIEMLRRIGWEGAAMVEYRFDPARNEAWLMEVNGRFWGSLPLAHYSGAEFAWLTYAILGEGLSNTRCAPRAGVRCRASVTETKRLFRILFAPGRIQDRSLKFSKAGELARYVSEFFNPRTRWFVYTSNDPKPFFADAYFSLRDKFTGS